MHSSIFLTGFRATGKTTLAKAVAEKLKWEFFDSDQIIEERTGMSIDEMTKHGTDWKLFRQMEVDVLKEYLNRKNIVFAMGGGMAVNDFPKEGTEVTFGELERDLLDQANGVLLVRLTAPEKVMTERIRAAEMASGGAGRPILDPVRALEFQSMDKDQLVNEIVMTSVRTFRMRQPAYNQLTDNVVDTGQFSVEQCAEKVIEMM